MGRRAAALCALLFAAVWTSLSFSFMWNCAPAGAIAASLYTSVVYTVTLLCIRRLARARGSAAVFGTAALWAVAEIFRSVVPILYFPWLLLGHSLAGRAEQQIDFDALIGDAVKLLRGEIVPPGVEADELRDRLLAGFQHILVDETDGWFAAEM